MSRIMLRNTKRSSSSLFPVYLSHNPPNFRIPNSEQRKIVTHFSCFLNSLEFLYFSGFCGFLKHFRNCFKNHWITLFKMSQVPIETKKALKIAFVCFDVLSVLTRFLLHQIFGEVCLHQKLTSLLTNYFHRKFKIIIRKYHKKIVKLMFTFKLNSKKSLSISRIFWLK